MGEKEYNLLHEKWIRVRYIDGSVKEIGFIDVLKDAQLIKCLAGELPTQDLAIMRVLVAALYSIYLRVDADGNERTMNDPDIAVDEWGKIWSRSKFEPSIIDGYFGNHEDRFFLIHPDRPFFQAIIEKGTDYSVAKLNSEVSESGNKHRLFVPLCGANKIQLTFAQTARWLIHAVAFDDASAKQKDKSNGSVQMSVGWLGQIGPVYAEGNNLFETLMLNLVFVYDDKVMLDSTPIWESDSIRVREREKVPLPEGPAELLTLQSRRISLKIDGDKVCGYSLIGGDIVSPVNALIEQMTSWKNDKEKNGWVPKRLREDVSMWRDYSSLLYRNMSSASEESRVPGVIEWMSLLYNNGHIPYKSIRIRSTGMVYGNMFSSIQNIIDDSLSLNAQLLSRLNTEWNFRISKSIERIEQAVKHIGTFQSELLECDGFKKDDASVKQRRDYRKGEAYFHIDQPFRRWLSSIDPSIDDIDESIEKLYVIVRNILLSLGREMMGDINDVAMVGKEKTIPANGSKYCINAFKSFSKFETNVFETLRGVTEDGDQ